MGCRPLASVRLARPVQVDEGHLTDIEVTDRAKAATAAEHPQPPNHAGRPKKAKVLKWLSVVQRDMKAQQDVAAFTTAFTQLQATEQVAARKALQALRQRLDALLAGIPDGCGAHYPKRIL